jgi:hypothetical protein
VEHCAVAAVLPLVEAYHDCRMLLLPIHEPPRWTPGMQVSFHCINATWWTWYCGTKIANNINTFQCYFGFIVLFLVNASLPLGTSSRHASGHTIINFWGGSNNKCSY